MKKIIVTTSWDDGHELDLKLADLLNKYNLKGTFYIPKISNLKSLTDENLKEISKTQEIGAHTLTHPDLREISLGEAEKEIVGSKEYLENLLNKEVEMFCYPKGRYNQDIKNLIKKAGFIGARTTKKYSIKKPEDFFEIRTTVNVYPFPLRKRNKNYYHLSKFLFQPLTKGFFKILKLKLPINSFFNWNNLAKNTFNYVLENGGIYHIWGHSWEIEKYGMWEDLEEIFKYISNRKDVFYLTNSQILD